MVRRSYSLTRLITVRSLHRMKGVFFSSELPELCEIRDFEIPQPGADEVLVKNAAVASNPKDWKMPMRLQWQAIEGNDIAGYIEAVGSKVTGFKKGDKVMHASPA